MQTALDNREKPEFIYESDQEASFLVVRCGAELPEYQVSMLEHNNISFVIPLNIVRKDGINHFYYNITSKISLALFLKRKKFSRQQFLKFLIDVVSTINVASGYLLSCSNFILDAEYIYINPENLEPALVYVPARFEEGWGSSIQNFVSDLLMQHINAEGFEGENLVQRILAAVNRQQFYVKGFLNLLNELLYGRRSPDGNMEGLVPASDAVLSNGDSGNKPLYSCGTNEKAAANKASGAIISGSGTTTGTTVNRTLGSREDISKTEKSSRYGNKNLWLAVLALLVQVLIGIAIYSLRDLLDNIGGNPAVTYVAVAMIVIALEILLFKKIKDSGFIVFEKGNPDGMKPEQDDEKVSGIFSAYNAYSVSGATGATGASEIPGTHSFPGSLRSSDVSGCNTDDAFYTAENPGETEIKAPAEAASFSDKTELLSNQVRRVPVLKSRDRRGIMEDIYIDKDDFIIGRLEGHADYVIKNNAVGKLHVQLIRRDGAFYVRDLNSVNGTYINDVRIESNKDYEIKENDILRIANCEYGFYGGYGL